MNGYILTKLAQICCYDFNKNWLEFGYPGHIFKVKRGHKMWGNGLSAPYLLKQWMDFDESCKSILSGHGHELLHPMNQTGMNAS